MNIGKGSASDVILLARAHSLTRQTVFQRSPGLNLDEAKHFIPQGNDIDFSPPASKIPLQHMVTAGLQVSDRFPLSPSTQLLFVHFYHLDNSLYNTIFVIICKLKTAKNGFRRSCLFLMIGNCSSFRFGSSYVSQIPQRPR
jgi:hypothetical protein